MKLANALTCFLVPNNATVEGSSNEGPSDDGKISPETKVQGTDAGGKKENFPLGDFSRFSLQIITVVFAISVNAILRLSSLCSCDMGAE